MDLNNFFKKCYDRYSKYGVTMVDISVWNNICSIYLMRPEGNEKPTDTFYVGTEPEPQDNLLVQYAHCKFEMSLDEEKVFECLDGWFSTYDKNNKPTPLEVKLKYDGKYKELIGKHFETGMDNTVTNSYTLIHINPTDKICDDPAMKGRGKLYECMIDWKIKNVPPIINFDEQTLNELSKNGISFLTIPYMGTLFYRIADTNKNK